MRYSFLSAAFLAFASSVVAQTAGFDAITAPTQDQNIPAGSTFDIVWQPGNVTGTITLTLLQGATASTLEAGPVVAANIDNTLGTCKWNVPASSTFATYGFKLTLDANTTEFQYSFPFHITGGTTTSITNSNAAQGPASTTTIHLSTGPSFTPSPTSTSTSSIPTLIHTNNSTTSTLAPSTSASSNVTLSPLKTTSTQTQAASSAGSSATSSLPAPIPSTGAAVANLAQGGLALVGGLVIALAL